MTKTENKFLFTNNFDLIFANIDPLLLPMRVLVTYKTGLVIVSTLNFRMENSYLIVSKISFPYKALQSLNFSEMEKESTLPNFIPDFHQHHMAKNSKS